MKTGLPRHLMITYSQGNQYRRIAAVGGEEEAYVLALRYGSQVDLDFRLCEHVRGSGHVDQEICIRAQLSAIASSRFPIASHNIFRYSLKSTMDPHLAP